MADKFLDSALQFLKVETPKLLRRAKTNGRSIGSTAFLICIFVVIIFPGCDQSAINQSTQQSEGEQTEASRSEPQQNESAQSGSTQSPTGEPVAQNDHGHEHTKEGQDDPEPLDPELGFEALLEIARENDEFRSADAVLLMIDKEIPETLLEEFSVRVARCSMSDKELIRLAGEQAAIEIGKPIADNLTSLLSTGENADFAAVCATMRYLGTHGADLIPSVQDGLDDGNPNIRRMVLFAIDNAGEHAIPLLPRLIELLKDENFNIQVGACQAIDSIGAEAISAQPALIELLEDGNISARSWAMIALGAIGTTPDIDPVDLIEPRLKAFTQPEKERALRALAHLGPDAIRLSAEVRAMMTDVNRRCEPWAAYTMYRIDQSEDAIEVLIKYLSDETYRRPALEMLNKLGPDAKTAIDPIIDNLPTGEPDVIESSMIAIRSIGRGTDEQVVKLQPYLENADPLIRFHTRKAIAALQGREEE